MSKWANGVNREAVLHTWTEGGKKLDFSNTRDAVEDLRNAAKRAFGECKPCTADNPCGAKQKEK